MLQYHVKQSWAQWSMSVGKEETDWCCAELLDECLVGILQIQNKPLTLYIRYCELLQMICFVIVLIFHQCVFLTLYSHFTFDALEFTVSLQPHFKESGVIKWKLYRPPPFMENYKNVF